MAEQNAGAPPGAPPAFGITEEELLNAKEQYQQAIRRRKDAIAGREGFAQNNRGRPGFGDMMARQDQGVADAVRDLEVAQSVYVELRERYSAAASLALARSNNEIAIEQMKAARNATSAAEKQADAAEKTIELTTSNNRIADAQLAVAKKSTNLSWWVLVVLAFQAVIFAGQLWLMYRPASAAAKPAEVHCLCEGAK